jgi:hypothetical protein
MTIKVELLNQDALALLRNLEQLKLLKLTLPAKQKNKSALPKAETANGQAAAPIYSFSAAEAIKPLRKNLTLEELLAEQNFRGFDRQELDHLIEEINIQEPTEELLALLTT